jgi:hypothetical protein
VSAKDMLSLTASGGRPDEFNRQLVKALRKGSLDPNACAWLADFFENGGAGDLKFTLTRSRPGNPRAKRKYPWNPSGVYTPHTWPFRMLTEECGTKEEAFERAREELNIGKNRAEKYWQNIKEQKAREAEDPYYAETYQGWKEGTLQERADNARGYCDVPTKESDGNRAG